MMALMLEKPANIHERPLVLREAPVPEPDPGEARIKVRACGVCHTDLHIAEGELIPPSLPIIPGHQVVGVVDALGPPAKDRPGPERKLGLGQRVGITWLYSSCGVCEHCSAGLENLCNCIRFTGFSANGGYAQYMVVPQDFAVPLPDRFSDAEAAPLLCAGVIGYRSLRVAGVQPGETIGLFGFGASAHLTIQVARHWDCRVLVFTRSPEHQRLALDLGAYWVGKAGERPPATCDRAITFAPAGWLIPEALKVLKRGGTLAINAVHLDKIPEFPYDLLYWEKRLVSVSNATRRDAAEFLEIAAAIPIRVTAQSYPLELANEALINLKAAKTHGAAVLQVPG